MRRVALCLLAERTERIVPRRRKSVVAGTLCRRCHRVRLCLISHTVAEERGVECGVDLMHRLFRQPPDQIPIVGAAVAGAPDRMDDGLLVLKAVALMRLTRAGRGRAPAVHRLESGAGFRVLVG
jgi:hypothetical protein